MCKPGGDVAGSRGMCHLSVDSSLWVPALGTSVIAVMHDVIDSAASISSSTTLQALANRTRLVAVQQGQPLQASPHTAFASKKRGHVRWKQEQTLWPARTHQLD